MAWSHRTRAGAAATASLALLGLTVSSANAALPSAVCDTTKSLTLLNFNDFHGRLSVANPNTMQFVGTIEEQRSLAGIDNTVLGFAGDAIGATLFSSFAQNDEPTIDLLNVMTIDGASVGNHEFDQGWHDLRDRVLPQVNFPYLGANVYLKGTTTPALPAFAVFTKNGLRIGMVGGVTGDLPSLVSPAGLADLDIGDPVTGVNAAIAQLKDGNEANGEADVIIAEYHEGGPDGARSLADNMALSPAFADIVNRTDPRAQAVMTGHTHQAYAFAGPLPGGGTRPVMSSGQYASNVGRAVLTVDALTGATCSYEASVLQLTTTPQATLEANFPRVAAAKQIVTSAVAQAAIIGERVVGTATAPITRALSRTVSSTGVVTIGDDRARESAMSNAVAQMFKDVLGPDNSEFIGIQNPGGTRADFDSGNITYAEAASVLPFANTLMTAELTGAQVKTVLEQQWQRTSAGAPLTTGRTYLRLGLSSNVTYTYDASRPWDDRITSISVNGRPIDPTKTYTVGSGSFLIAAGDNFWEFARATNKRDTGRADLESFVGWVQEQGSMSPAFTMRGVSLKGAPPALIKGDTTYTVDLQLGTPQLEPERTAALGPKSLDTLDFKTSRPDGLNQPIAGPANTTLTAALYGFSGKGKARLADGTVIGTAPVVNGQVASIDLRLPGGVPAGTAWLRLTAGPSGTTVYWAKVTLKSTAPTK